MINVNSLLLYFFSQRYVALVQLELYTASKISPTGEMQTVYR